MNGHKYEFSPEKFLEYWNGDYVKEGRVKTYSIPEFAGRETIDEPLIVVEIKMYENKNQLEIQLMTGEKQHSFVVKMHEIGIAIPSTLENIITKSIERSRAFAQLLSDFREGKKINFPVKLD